MPTLPRKKFRAQSPEIKAGSAPVPAHPADSNSTSDPDLDQARRNGAERNELQRMVDEAQSRRAHSLHSPSRTMLVPNEERYASKYGASRDIYWSRSDEATRDSWYNAIALGRSEFVYELMRGRQWPVSGLSWRIEVDEPKDDDQKRAADRIDAMVDAIPGFQAMRLYLGQDKWYGKYGSQVTWDHVYINGKRETTIVDHEPVNGDSIVYKYDKTPGILVRGPWQVDARNRRYVESSNETWVKGGPALEQADRGMALFLYDRAWRDRFVFTNFEPDSPDFFHEGEKAASIFGVGLRGRLYWALQNREELRTWLYDALQRIGVNGMLYAFYESGNVEALKNTLNALKLLIRDNLTAFPWDPKSGRPPDKLEHIEPSQVGYEILFKEIERLEDSMRRGVLGQSLSSTTESTGMGSEVAELHRSTFEHIMRFDANCQGESLTRDIVGPMIRMNQWPWRGRMLNGFVPFRIRLVFNLDKANTVERSQVYETGVNLGLKVSKEQMYEDLSLSPPKGPWDELVPPQAQAGAGGGPGGGGPTPANGDPGRRPAPGRFVLGPDGKLRLPGPTKAKGATAPVPALVGPKGKPQPQPSPTA